MDRIVVAGDWHGNGAWAASVISEAANLLSDQDEKLIVQLGDFGVWPGEYGERFIETVTEACLLCNVKIWFPDGNHEDFSQIERFKDGDPVRWLPRWTRWVWHGRTWLACGGAVSVDRAVREEGVSWWPQEEITPVQAAAIMLAGPADVMIAHDCPSAVMHVFPFPPSFWDLRDLARADVHRERLQGIVDKVQPKWIMHGHLHRCYERHTDLGYGEVRVTGLDMDGRDGNFAVLNVETMEWVT